jgi:hypothetical protein
MTVKELIDTLLSFPEDEPIYIPVGVANIPVDNVVLTDRGVVLDYLIMDQYK